MLDLLTYTPATRPTIVYACEHRAGLTGWRGNFIVGIVSVRRRMNVSHTGTPVFSGCDGLFMARDSEI